jgi:hypothetical protein
LGIPYMDTVTGSFAAQTPAKTQFSPIRSANFSLKLLLKNLLNRYRRGEVAAAILITAARNFG